MNKKPSLKNFYKTYDMWVQEGRPEGIPYTNYQGLCGALRQYVSHMSEEQVETRTAIWRGFFSSFEQAGLNKIIPFNETFSECLDEQEKGLCAFNSSRLDWVQSHREK